MCPVAQRALTQLSFRKRIALAVVGFTAVVAQIVLMRELLIASYGNELSVGIMLALWLVWTAIGSSYLGRLFSSVSTGRILSSLLIAAAVALYLAIFIVRASRTYWHAGPGEVLGPVPIFLTACITLAVICPISGWLFVAGSRYCADSTSDDIAQAGSSMYLLEAIGSAIGGVLVSIIFLRFLGTVQIATIVVTANLLVAVAVGVAAHRARLIISLCVIVAGIGIISAANRLEISAVSQSWPGFRVLATKTSPYGSLTVVETEGNRSMIQNGTILFTSPDQPSAEEAVHFPLLLHSMPRSVLLIGGGLNGSIAEILKYRSVERVDYVELDPAILSLARQYFSREWSLFAADVRVHTHEMDGRLFVSSTPLRFDVIILNLPEPQTAQLNRFYTEEFFRQVSSRLAAGGVFGFQMRASEEYLSPQMAEFLRCLNATLRGVFSDVVIIPGETVHFVASQQPGILSTDPQVLVRRIEQRGVQTAYIREYYLPFRMSPERNAAIADQLRPEPGTRINRDFAPIAYFFNVELWSTQFSSRYRAVFRVVARIPLRFMFSAVLALVVLMTFAFSRVRQPSSRARVAAASAVALMGLTLMASEILLLLGFQAVYGYVFNELALIIAGVMAGMAFGSGSALRRQERLQILQVMPEIRRLLFTQIAATAFLLLLTPLIAGLGQISSFGVPPILIHSAFLALALTSGFIGGYQFPSAMSVFSAANREGSVSPGSLYGIDLFGASFGAIIISVLLLPLVGFSHTAELMAIMNLGPVILLAVSLKDA